MDAKEYRAKQGQKLTSIFGQAVKEYQKEQEQKKHDIKR